MLLARVAVAVAEPAAVGARRRLPTDAGCTAGVRELQLRPHRRHGDDDPRAHRVRHGHHFATDAGLLVQQRRELLPRRGNRHVRPRRTCRSFSARSRRRRPRCAARRAHTRPVRPACSTASTTRAASASSSPRRPTTRGLPASNAAAGDAGDAGPSIPRTTIPFDISRYKAFTFWGMTTTPDPTTGSLQVKVQFPDTDTDPRGEICNGGSGEYLAVLQQLRSAFEIHDQLAAVHGVAGCRRRWRRRPVRRHRHRSDVGLPTGEVDPRPRFTASTGRRSGTSPRTQARP